MRPARRSPAPAGGDDGAAGGVRAAVVLLGLGGLSGGGGAERFFTRAVADLAVIGRPGCRVDLVTDLPALAGAVQAGCGAGHALVLPSRGGPLRVAQVARDLLALQRREGFDVLLFPLPTPRYLPALWALQWLPARAAPRVAIGVVDCGLSHGYSGGRWRRVDMEQAAVNRVYRAFFATAALDGVFTWYRRATELIQRTVTPSDPLVAVLPTPYVDTSRFAPAARKERTMVFAGRLSSQKRPLLFLEALARVRVQRPDLLRGWRVDLYGHGVLEARVDARCARVDLAPLVSRLRSDDLAPALARSRLFVSTQAYDNFSSLAMLEAMACGNAVLACDVGETRRFVRDGRNGVLAAGEEVEHVADALARYLEAVGNWTRWEDESRRLAVEEFTAPPFVRTFQDFVIALAGRRKRTWLDAAVRRKPVRAPR